MKFVQLHVSDEEVGRVIQLIGSRFGKLHMTDVSSNTKADIKRAKAWKLQVSDLMMMEKTLDGYEALMAKYDVPLPSEEVPLEQNDFSPIGTCPGRSNRKLGEEMKQFFVKYGGNEVNRHNKFIKELEMKINEIEEKITVLEFAKSLPNKTFKETGGAGYQNPETENLITDTKKTRRDVELGQRAGYKIIFGTVPTYMKLAFKRTLARVSRFNAVPVFSSDEVKLLDRGSSEPVAKVPFYVVTVGRYISTAFTEKLATYMNINLVEVAESKDAIDKQLQDMRISMKESQDVLRETQKALRKTLRKFANCKLGPEESYSPIITWRAAIRQEKEILRVMQLCRFDINIVEMAGWVPAADAQKLVDLVSAEVGAMANVEVLPEPEGRVKAGPPTYFPTNEFTGQFQSIVDTYGIASYKEVNPGLFTCVTFPFLFGVMYGDIGHGLLMTIFGSWLVLNGQAHEKLARKRQLDEMTGMMHGARYVLFLMGLFGLYCGTIYNDCFSVPINAFGSHWDSKGYWIGGKKGTFSANGPYPYGVDPTWYGTTNQLQFFNSLKMKISVILGVTQMTFGIFLGSFNHVYERDWLGLFLEWIPRMLFMTCTFGYMIGIIIYKWCVDWSQPGLNSPPNLIQTMIKMFLSPGVVPSDSELYPGQAQVQLYLIVTALISVPVMLLAKPCILHFCCSGGASKSRRHDTESGTEMDQVAHEKTGLVKGGHKKGGYGSLGDDEKKVTDAHPPVNDHEEDHGEHSFSDVLIHQGIHTIEFVLGCVSNTASYLRLWALSLAHAELSEVFWSKLIVGLGLEGGFGPVGMVIGFGAWFIATFAVLLCMDTMECVLHALRLHWVEFQNKFYRAEGYKFDALDFTSEAFLYGE